MIKKVFKSALIIVALGISLVACQKSEVNTINQDNVLEPRVSAHSYSHTDLFGVTPKVLHKKSGGDVGDIVYDYDGNAYRTMVTDEQIWFVDNLKTTKNGFTTTLDYANRSNDPNGIIYGRYYYRSSLSTAALTNFQGIYSKVGHNAADRIQGFRVPTFADFNKLVMFCGGAEYISAPDALDIKLYGSGAKYTSSVAFDALNQDAQFLIQDKPVPNPDPSADYWVARVSTYYLQHPYPQMFYEGGLFYGRAGVSAKYIQSNRLVKDNI